MSRLHQVKSYISYWLNAVNEHSLQGPFIYDFYQKVFKAKDNLDSYSDIENVRRSLLQSTQSVEITDYGAGSTVDNNSKRKISDIAKYGTTNAKYGRLLHGIIEFTESKNILELGTSLGISTLYLSKNNSSHVITIEGARDLAELAGSIFLANHRDNIRQITGNIDNVLPELLLQSDPFDLVFFDANHTKAATLNYFNQCLKRTHKNSCFVFDDIHWSRQMESAWDNIRNHYSVTLSIDIFQMGIVFFNPEIRKQHYVLQF